MAIEDEARALRLHVHCALAGACFSQSSAINFHRLVCVLGRIARIFLVATWNDVHHANFVEI